MIFDDFQKLSSGPQVRHDMPHVDLSVGKLQDGLVLGCLGGAFHGDPQWLDGLSLKILLILDDLD